MFSRKAGGVGPLDPAGPRAGFLEQPASRDKPLSSICRGDALGEASPRVTKKKGGIASSERVYEDQRVFCVLDLETQSFWRIEGEFFSAFRWV